MSKRLPRLWRKKRGGKFYGNWLATIDGADVSLQTKDAELARKRLPAALRGAREFESDAAAAAAASEPGVEELGGTEAVHAVEAAPIAAPSSPTPAQPDQVIPPDRQLPPLSSSDAAADAEATQAAADQVAGDAGAAGDDKSEFDLPPEVLEQLLEQAGQAIAIGQIELQGWLIKKKVGAAPAPAYQGEFGQKMVAISGKAWVAQLEQWFPDLKTAPPWIIALGAPLMLLPAQAASAVAAAAESEKNGQNPADSPPAQAAA